MTTVRLQPSRELGGRKQLPSFKPEHAADFDPDNYEIVEHRLRSRFSKYNLPAWSQFDRVHLAGQFIDGLYHVVGINTVNRSGKSVTLRTFLKAKEKMKPVQNILKKTAGKPACIRAVVLALIVLLLTGLTTAGLVLLIWLPPYIRAVPFWPLIIWGCMIFIVIALLLWKRFKSWGASGTAFLQSGDWTDGLTEDQWNTLKKLSGWAGMPYVSSAHEQLFFNNGQLVIRYYSTPPKDRRLNPSTFVARAKRTAFNVN